MLNGFLTLLQPDDIVLIRIVKPGRSDTYEALERATNLTVVRALAFLKLDGEMQSADGSKMADEDEMVPGEYILTVKSSLMGQSHLTNLLRPLLYPHRLHQYTRNSCLEEMKEQYIPSAESTGRFSKI